MQDLSEFWSGEDYDQQYAHLYEDDIALIEQVIEEKQAKSLLDICCGTGIVTIPLAEKLEHVVGVDLSPDMLKRAEQKVSPTLSVRFIEHNAVTFSLQSRFDVVIMTGNAFQAFANDMDFARLLSNIAAHLNPEGVFIFDTRLPTPQNLSLDDDFKACPSYLDVKGEQVQCFRRAARYDKENKVLYSLSRRIYADGSVKETSIDLKYRSIETIEGCLTEAGFIVDKRYADWRRSKWSENSNSLICVAKKVNRP
ncbi:class I SAM-dependent methyltransferase [Grimontia sp. SpTr1]|uniref:class I SAM-dependent DNA methyltransferase n=1 Tax=Grimontia sp. SpTr1 TaxID=2995319 RepID=UPI00248A9361|nr:class I SAM-dependent methyltransferase [Grimontia sp. SpTr1]